MTIWTIAALSAGFFTALFVYINQVLRLDPVVGMVYRGIVLGVFLLPILFFLEPVANPYFYIICSIQGFFIYFKDAGMFRLSKTIGAEATSLFQPLGMIAVFFVWLAIKPEQLVEIMDNKVLFLTELFCLVLMAISIMKINNSKTSQGVIIKIFPLIIYIVIIDNIHKIAIGYGVEGVVSAVIYYNFITAFIIGVCSVFFYKKEKIKFNFFSRQGLYPILIAVFSGFAAVSKSTAMFYTPNPAYVTAVIGTMPLWVVAINYAFVRLGIVKEVKKLDLKYTVLLIASASTLIVLANH